MQMMECRQIQLEKTIEGLSLSDVPLVSYHEAQFLPAGFADDLGIYYFIPTLAKAFGLSADQAINLFFGSLLALGALIATTCFFFAFKNGLARSIILLAISLLTWTCFRYSDVYIALFFAVTSTLPFFLLAPSLPSKPPPWKWGLAFLCSGIIAGYCNFIRSHSGTGVLLFLLAWLLLNPHFRPREKALYLVTLFLATLLPYLHFHSLENKRDLYLSEMYEGHQPLRITHPKWHAVYLGLGYLPNKHGITFSDRCAWEKALSIDPTVKNCSPEYGRILRNQVWTIAKEDPLFILKTLTYKVLSILLRVALFSNVGLLLFFYVKPPPQITLPLAITLMFYSLPGILVMPINAYLAGMASVATLFGLYLICSAIEKYRQRRPHAVDAMQV